MVANSSLNKAKTSKSDEFYTQLADIEKEMEHYKKHFENKIVYCNCDNPVWSAFWKYFHLHFAELGLKRLIFTHYDATGDTYSMTYCGGNDSCICDGTVVRLKGNGDFRSDECIELLRIADIVMTNPPFSLFREYLAQLMTYRKSFLILGNMNALTYKEVFPLMKDNKVWYGPSISSGDRKFNVPDDYELKAAGCGIDENGQKYIRVKGVRWFTNLDHSKRHKPINLTANYSPNKYSKYDDYDAIEVSKSLDIPVDYDGVMGVPITFMDKYCPEQFEIIWLDSDNKDVWVGHGPKLNGRNLYRRLFIKRRVAFDNENGSDVR